MGYCRVVKTKTTGRQAVACSISMMPERWQKADKRVRDLSPRISNRSQYVQVLIDLDLTYGIIDNPGALMALVTKGQRRPFDRPLTPLDSNALLTGDADLRNFITADARDGVVAQLVEHHNGIVVGLGGAAPIRKWGNHGADKGGRAGPLVGDLWRDAVATHREHSDKEGS